MRQLLPPGNIFRTRSPPGTQTGAAEAAGRGMSACRAGAATRKAARAGRVSPLARFRILRDDPQFGISSRNSVASQETKPSVAARKRPASCGARRRGQRNQGCARPDKREQVGESGWQKFCACARTNSTRWQGAHRHENARIILCCRNANLLFFHRLFRFL